MSIGVELEKIRWQLSMFNLQYICKETSRGRTEDEKEEDVTRDSKVLGNTNFLVDDIDNANSTDPFTHIYMYDLGFPPPLQQSIARKFNNSQYAQYLVSYRPPRRVIEEFVSNVYQRTLWALYLYYLYHMYCCAAHKKGLLDRIPGYHEFELQSFHSSCP